LIKKLAIASGISVLILLLIIFIAPFKKSAIPKPKNIIFLLFDAMRPDHLGAYRYARNTSPTMDAIAKDGILFERAYSQASWTLPSVASIFTSTYTDFHGTENMTSRLPKNLVTLAEYILKSGYQTCGASNNYLVSRNKKMTRGFWDWIDEMRDPALTDFLLSYLDPQNINYYRLWKDNCFSDYSFTRLNPNLKTTGDLYKYGCFDRSAYKTSRARWNSDDPQVLSTSFKELPPGEYNWGAALKTLRGKGRIKLTLIERTPTRIKIMDQQIIEASKEWEIHTFTVRIPRNIGKMQICLNIITDDKLSQDFEIAADDVFIIPVNKKPENKQYFFYLHYINPHEPHHEPKEIHGRYAHLFTDFLKPSKLISESAGDPLDLSNPKYILHRSRIDAWIKLNDEINLQLNMYDREIKYMDDQVERIVKFLKKTGEYEDTMFIITADHGEEFLEHGHISHALSLYDEVIHIPLIISYPRAFPRGLRIKSNVASIDIFPTLVDMLRENTPYDEAMKKQITGKSLLPLIEDPDSADEKRVIFSADYFTTQVAAITGKWKLINRKSMCGSANVLFNMAKDVKETNNLALSENQRTASMQTAIQHYKETALKFRNQLSDSGNQAAPSEKDLKVMKRGLLELGYINADDDVFGISKKFEDVFCHVVRFRLQMKLLLKILLL
jgi:arylsulfatase A-like enzyme